MSRAGRFQSERHIPSASRFLGGSPTSIPHYNAVYNTPSHRVGFIGRNKDRPEDLRDAMRPFVGQINYETTKRKGNAIVMMPSASNDYEPTRMNTGKFSSRKPKPTNSIASKGKRFFGNLISRK